MTGLNTADDDMDTSVALAASTQNDESFSRPGLNTWQRKYFVTVIK